MTVLANVATAESGRERHGGVAGRGAVGVFETAEFGFELAAFFLFGLRGDLMSACGSRRCV